MQELIEINYKAKARSNARITEEKTPEPVVPMNVLEGFTSRACHNDVSVLSPLRAYPNDVSVLPPLRATNPAAREECEAPFDKMFHEMSKVNKVCAEPAAAATQPRLSRAVTTAHPKRARTVATATAQPGLS